MNPDTIRPGTHHLLIVEDEPMVLEMLAATMQVHGYRISKAATGDEAIEMIRSHLFDLVLTDLIMPSCSGMEVLRETKAHSPETHVIVLTGNEDINTAIDSFRLGADDYIIKPCKMEELLFRVDRCLSQKRDQQRIRVTETKLQRRENLLLQITEHIEDVFWLALPGMRKVLYVSPAFQTLFGCTCDDFIADPQALFGCIHPDDRFKLMREINLLSAHEKSVQCRIVRSGGGTRWINQRLVPIKSEAGRVIRVAGIVHDVTEEVRLRQESKERLQQVIQADRLAALGEVVAGVAHEINNPNSFITYNTPILRDTWHILEPILNDFERHNPDWRYNGMAVSELMDDMREIIEAIRIGSERINSVVTNLKDFAHLDEGSDKQPLKINDVVEKTMTIVGPQLKKSIGRVTLQLSDGMPHVTGHRRKLEQVVANILVNACYAVRDKATSQVSLCTRYLERLDCVLIEIEDNGIGMDSEQLDHLFEPFYTTRRANGGTGLGLSVSYGLVKEHNGLIGVLSRKNLGSRFTVYLPVGSDTRLNLNPTMLCVDDENSVLKLLQSRFLKVEDAFVETTTQPDSVVDYLVLHPEVDLVLSDIFMPGINGWDLLAEIKTRFPLMPVILYSGNITASGSQNTSSFEADGLLEKPFDFDSLFSTIVAIGRQRL